MTSRALLALALASLSFAAGCHHPPPIDPNAKPELQVGTGDGAFEPLGAGVQVPVNYGIQGGSHIWFAARCRGMGEAAALTYGIVDDQGNVVSQEQSAMVPSDDVDDEGFRTITSLTAYLSSAPQPGTHVIFKGHLEDDAGHAVDATGEAVVEPSSGSF
jgi:hypothetical protein